MNDSSVRVLRIGDKLRIPAGGAHLARNSLRRVIHLLWTDWRRKYNLTASRE